MTEAEVRTALKHFLPEILNLAKNIHRSELDKRVSFIARNALYDGGISYLHPLLFLGLFPDDEHIG